MSVTAKLINPQESDRAPFLILENPWTETGYFSVLWYATSEELRRLANEIDAANQSKGYQRDEQDAIEALLIERGRARRAETPLP